LTRREGALTLGCGETVLKVNVKIELIGVISNYLF